MKGLKSGYPGVMTRFCYRPRWRTRTNHEQLDWASLLQKSNPNFLQRNPTIIKTNPLQSSRWKRQTSIFLTAEGYKPTKWFGRCMEMFYPQTPPTIQTSMLSLLFPGDHVVPGSYCSCCSCGSCCYLLFLCCCSCFFLVTPVSKPPETQFLPKTCLERIIGNCP